MILQIYFTILYALETILLHSFQFSYSSFNLPSAPLHLSLLMPLYTRLPHHKIIAKIGPYTEYISNIRYSTATLSI